MILATLLFGLLAFSGCNKTNEWLPSKATPSGVAAEDDITNGDSGDDDKGGVTDKDDDEDDNDGEGKGSMHDHDGDGGDKGDDSGA